MIPDTLKRAPQRLKVFEFIKAELSAERPFPSRRAIADHMRWKNESAAIDCLRMLAGLDRVLIESRVNPEALNTLGPYRGPRFIFQLKEPVA